MDLRTVLAPTDFSEQSREGLALARDVALRYGARLVVLHVVDDALPALLPDVAGFRYDDLSHTLAERAEASLPEFFPAPEGDAIDIDYRVEFGVPHAEIVRVAEELPADLIVIATHGRTGAMHLLIGSVAEKVIRGCSCPVLVSK